MIVSSHLVLEVTIICITPEVNSNGVLIEGLCISVSLALYAKSFNTRVDKEFSFTINVFLL